MACEFSGIVRDAFSRAGHEAVSCDLLESETPGRHIVGDVLEVLDDGWDMMVAFPPCTYLTVSGNRWFKERPERYVLQDAAIDFVRKLWYNSIPKVCIENPVGVLSTRFMPVTQYIQPWMFGHGEVKKTCLWLRGLPLLMPSEVVDGRKPVVHNHVRSWKDRSRTYPGVALAMSNQWR